MTIRNALTAAQLKSLYVVVFTTNAIEHKADLIRGIVHVPVFPEEAEPKYSFFGQINQSVLEYENLAPFKVQTELSPGAAFQRELFTWPNEVTIVSTNTLSWMKPLVNDIKENTTWFDGREIHVLDLAQLVDCKENQIRESPNIEKVLPPCVRRGPAGSMSKLLRELEVDTSEFNDPIFAVKRARMIKAGVLTALDRDLSENNSEQL